MTKLTLALAMILTAHSVFAAQLHKVKGILVKIDAARKVIVVSCEAVPGFMDAMVMRFDVRGPLNLKSLAPGVAVRFDMVQKGNTEYAENIQRIEISNYESEPTEAGRLAFLNRALDPDVEEKVLKVGELVPDFTLIDQAHLATRLAQFRGKVVALTFAYSRCPNPNYCFRLSNNLAQLKKRFRASAGNDLILVTIVIDPNQDQGKVLENYADTWKADSATWRFLTGSLEDIRKIAANFGMNFWRDEGFLTHGFHTVVIDREGRLAANLEGNQFSARQLGDVVENVLKQTPADPSASVSLKSDPASR
ncbi:MAG: SCO family protein [Acidobacteria bacterium]|nr:SCO family protein [Acidobacteriota bacterium]